MGAPYVTVSQRLAKAIGDAEAQMLAARRAAEERCACEDGMFPRVLTERRGFLFGAGSLASSALLVVPASAFEAPSPPRVPADPTKELGQPIEAGYGQRSPFETETRLAPLANEYAAASLTPLDKSIGNLTPSGLHFERHHGGIPIIDPARHWLYVHGGVQTAKKFSMPDLKRFPSITRKYFIECSGNTSSEWTKPTLKTVQGTHGLLSTSEWTGVPFAMLAREVGLAEDAAWVLAEGADSAVMTRSIPLEKMLSDGLLAYGQNGEAIRPAQGYPLRLILPGYEGNTHIKWLRRLEVSDKPFMTREETSKYTDLMGDGKARQFTLIMDAKSVITFPSGEMRLPGAGFYTISGLAWSGRGRVRSAEVSVDGGESWASATLENTPEPFCTVRFSFPWHWNGQPAILQSRCTDETGYVQPTLKQLVAARPSEAPTKSGYHLNAIQSWAVGADGSVINVHT